MLKVGIIGATGYAGAELTRLLISHPEVDLHAISSVSFTGKKIAEVYPNLAGFIDKELVDEETLIDSCNVIFAGLPHGLSEKLGKKCHDSGKILIDLGADFRLKNEQDYKDWYDGSFAEKGLHELAVYGLPELFRDEIKTAKIIANPGCYPTSIALGLAPIMKNVPFVAESIVIDSKSGVTGAGRNPTQGTHFPDCNENFSAYKIAGHRHTPEIEQTLTELSGKKITVTFTPHLLPINRGILSTIYIKPQENISKETLHKLYIDFYKNEKFVRVLPLGAMTYTKNVAYSNYCDISLHKDERAGRIIVVSAIDNMIKGAAGQAIQNMNIICGFKEDTAINIVPPAF